MTLSFNPRRPLEDDYPDSYMESDRDFVANNFELCVWFLRRFEENEVQIHYQVAAGSAGVQPPFVTAHEADARARFDEERAVPSYFGPGHRRQPSLWRVLKIAEKLA